MSLQFAEKNDARIRQATTDSPRHEYRHTWRLLVIKRRKSERSLRAPAWAKRRIYLNAAQQLAPHPVSRCMAHNLQRGAGMRVQFLFNHHQRGGRFLNRVAKAEPGGERDAACLARGNTGKIQRDNAEAAGLHDEVGGFESILRAAAATNP